MTSKARELADLLDSSGNIKAKSGRTTQGRNLTNDGTKLDGIEANATADQTHSEIRALIVAGSDTNVFTDADHTKLDGIESGATADQTKADIDALNIDADTLDGKQLATIESEYQSYADTAAANVVDSAPAALNTLNELAAALGDDANFATTTATSLGEKLPKSGGQMTGNITMSGSQTVDGRDLSVDGAKLDGIEANAKNDQTITAGGGLTGGGTGDVTISHSDTSSVSSTNNSGNTFVQDLTFDTYGHVTAVGTGSVSVGNGTLTVQGTGALGGSGTFTANQSGNTTISISHDDTSSQGSVNNSSGTVIQDVTLDGYGHVTGLTSYNLDGRYFTESESDSRFVRKGVGYTWTAVGGNALSFRSNDTIDTTSGDQAALEIYQDNAGHDAFIQFHIAGDYGKYLGLHGGVNDFVVGGWSHGASYQRLYHDGYHPNADTLTTARTINGVSFNGSANITIADSTKLPLSGGTVTGDVQFNSGANIHRGTHSSGFLVGSYNSVGANSTKSNPIYTIGSNYQPSDTNLNDMYGIGYSHGNATFDGINTVLSDWGLYVAANGTARIGLDGGNGNIKLTGTVDGRDVAADGAKLDTIATNANYITNNNQLTNGAGYTTFTANQSLNTSSNPTFNQIYANDWFRVNGADGIYWQSYGGGWRMTDSSWMRVHNDKGIYTAGEIQGGTINTPSDINLKKDIVKIDDALDKLHQLNGYNFTFKATDKKSSGVIAQEVQKVMPQLVHEGADEGTLTVEYGNMVGLLIEAIKEQQTQIDDLKAEIQSMKS